MRKFSLAITTALALSLSACGGEGEGKLKGEPVAEVKAPEGQQWLDSVKVTEEGGYLIGNPDASIKLVEFGSLTCHVCADFSTQSSEELHRDYINTGKVSLEFRNFVRDPVDLAASRITHCAPKESFLALTEQFMEIQPEVLTRMQQLDEAAQQRIATAAPLEQPKAYAEAAGVLDFFTQRGVSTDQIDSCLADGDAITALAERTKEYGKKYDIPGTPTFLINGKAIGVTAWPAVKTALQAAGAR
ncbi:MAG: thioredoxin domain-containing protein [Sphingorhabdus sp.]